jgi:pimeloyl-ACP methyl ester carboxylesterase
MGKLDVRQPPPQIPPMNASTSPALPPALPGEHRELHGRAGRLGYYVAGNGPPMLLVHSVNAAASAYETKPIYEHAMARHRVWAPDLPGFGTSDRSDRPYERDLFVAAIHDMLDAIAADAGSAPVDALAISLGSEFLVHALIERPDRVRTLALVTPTGFSRRYADMRGPPGSSREVPGLHAFFTFPLWSQGIYDLLVSRRGIRYFLQRTFGSAAIDEGMVEYDYLTSHQPGAKHAPFAFVAGRLFSRDIQDAYRRLTIPVWVPHATRGDFKDFGAAGWTAERANWRLQPYPTGALPHFEQPKTFLADYDHFLTAAAQPLSLPSGPRSPSP